MSCSVLNLPVKAGLFFAADGYLVPDSDDDDGGDDDEVQVVKVVKESRRVREVQFVGSNVSSDTLNAIKPKTGYVKVRTLMYQCASELSRYLLIEGTNLNAKQVCFI